MTTVSVCFPWRSDGGGDRDQTADWVCARWNALLPEYELVRGVPDDGPFNRSVGINRAFLQSVGEVIIAADLDVVFQKDAVEEAVERAKDGEWGFAFRNYYKLTKECSRRVRDASPDVSLAYENIEYEDWHWEVNSGLVVISREGFCQVGGFDQRFIGWGYEDNAFLRLADHRWGPHFRIEHGEAFHLWHPSNDVAVITEKNRKYYEATYLVGDLDFAPRYVE